MFCSISISADIEDVTRLVRSLYTGKIDLCPKSVEKIIALCKTLRMEEEVKFYEEVAKKELNVTGSSDSENNVKPVIPVCRVEKSDTGALFTYLAEDEEKIRDSGEGVGSGGLESPQMRHVGMEHTQASASGTPGDVLPIDTEIKQEYADDEEDDDGGEFFRLQDILSGFTS